jgi:O-succinylbenzoic acid--CoA ligase
MPYAYHEIICNHRAVLLDDILASRETARSAFEESTFAFIREWLGKAKLFSQFTSGSTGTPKEIILTRTQLRQSTHRTLTALTLTAGDTALVCLDTKYIAGKMMVVRALDGNLKMVATEPSSNPLLNLPVNTPIDFVALVPLQLETIVNDQKSTQLLNSCKAVIIGGAAVNPSLHQKISNLACPIYATYGMTETVSHIALQRLNGPDSTDYFLTLPEIGIESDNQGCLIIRHPDFENPIHTNDLVEINSPTQFRILGRADNVINSGGYKIFPEKIEKEVTPHLAEVGIYNSFIAAAKPDALLGQKLILIIEGHPTMGTKELLLERLKKYLNPFDVPKDILFLPQFERTETGKINRPKTVQKALIA